ncbi:MAG: hypothetical protein WBB00_24335 [Mycobacterium sp.]
MSKQSTTGGSIGGAIFVLLVLIAMIPKTVWIVLGVTAAIGGLIWFVSWAVSEEAKRRKAAEERARIERAAQAAADKRAREERARKEKQQRIATLGKENAALVESAQAAVKRVLASEAARDGWLGDVDFTADIQSITENFRKAHALRKVASKLSALDKPSADDRKLLAEAMTTTANLECAGIERVELIGKCATEARLIDKSLDDERKDARTAEQRAELHGQLSAMLYGIEATPDTTPTDSAADGVMARVMAYREIKNQIQLARDS